MTRPEVSVIIPTVRADSHFVDALDSVLSQNDIDLEVVVVLDGVDVRDTPLPDDPRILVVELPERRGTATALNAGIEAASAEFIARLDADDLARAGRLHVQADRLASSPATVCVASAVDIIDGQGRHLGVLAAHRGDVSSALLRRNVLTHSSTMYRRSAVRAVGGYDPSCVRMQDYDLWLRLAREGRVEVLTQPLTAYRVHPGQHSRRTPPWGSSTRTILRSRRRLAAHLGRSGLAQRLDDALWLSAQLVRHLGLRRPHYLRGTKSR
ncbi:glycosyltransferase family 2 protein [Frondihabitans australicus]|uniref:Glycosyltransferase 2-like domain-containing protein n=1 Tax=Frondihabitans australicus TaxID=386892 RepID=A0A495ILT3_9MICO|nr:glycosyltransferase family 2 protein [Frondihabitans australicus]RKR76126.1 hypothetical protein C8E83_3291 [Frondihabitans australicus]